MLRHLALGALAAFLIFVAVNVIRFAAEMGPGGRIGGVASILLSLAVGAGGASWAVSREGGRLSLHKDLRTIAQEFPVACLLGGAITVAVNFFRPGEWLITVLVPLLTGCCLATVLTRVWGNMRASRH